MYLRTSAVTLTTVLVAACSAEVSMPESGPGAFGDPPDAQGAAQLGGSSDGTSTAGGQSVVNPDGTMTITNPDGSTTTVNASGEVIATTPANAGTEGAAALSSNCQPGTPATTQLPRLTGVQYDNTVRTLLGVDLQLSATTLQEDSKGAMDARSWTSYQQAAEQIASTILIDAAARANVITCTTEDAACATDIITNFGAKVYRRPLSADEVSAYEAMYADTALTETGSFDEQIQVVFEAMFQSPYFLSKAEIADNPSADGNGETRYALSDYEVASRLSYMLWDNMPDQVLIDAAAAGSLTTAQGIAEQAARMLKDDQAKGLVSRMHSDYLHMGPNTRWVGYERDAAKYPHYSPTQIDAIASETLRVAESVVFGGGTFADLMTTTVGFVNADTAPLYGLDPSGFGDELAQADLGPERPGVLTRAGFLAANAYGNRTSPIHRGAFIEKEVLCATIGSPDPAAAATPLPGGDGLVTNRQKTEAQTAIAPDCEACHRSMVNPPGFALEGFDAVGGIQTEDNGVPVDTTADVLIGSRVVSVQGASDLMAAIAASPEAARCYSENWVQVAYNKVLSAQDSCTVDEIAAKMTGTAYTVANLITDLATTETFRYRAHESEVAQ